ncbi:cation:dicarboxylase symporter family transporter [Novosphingobium sp.]|uniref:dicarboxylate/amino acid:cation symporter n=1 Tax=Novosphingobium sp. TaxID=1874826 RepID=UPI003340D0E0
MNRTVLLLAVLVFGTLVGVATRWSGHAGLIAAATAVLPIGTLWVRALQMTLIPLIFALVTHGVASAVAGGRGGRLIGSTFGLFGASLLVAVTSAMALTEVALRIWPLPAHALDGLTGETAPQVVPGLAAQLTAIIPDNPVAAAAQGQIFPLVVFGLVLGIALARLPRAIGQDGGALDDGALMRMLADLKAAMLQIVDWVLVLAPLGIFVLALGLGLSSGIGVAQLLATYLALGLATGVMMIALCYGAILAFGAAPVRWFAGAIVPAQAMAAGSCSSMATTPVMIEVAVERLMIPEDVVGLTIPLAVSVFRIGSVSLCSAGVLVAAHAAGIQPGPVLLVLTAIAILLACAGAAGLPGAAVLYASSAPAMHLLGAPMAILPLYIAVVALIDPVTTAANVTGDLTVVTLVNRWLNGRTAPLRA